MGNLTKQQVKAYLAGRGIPRGTVDNIILCLAEEATENSDRFVYDRIYTAVGLMLNECFGFGSERTLRGLRYFDNLCGSISDEEGTQWPDLMERLKQNTGIVIRSGGDDRLLVEYTGSRHIMEDNPEARKLADELNAKKDGE